MRVGKPGGSEKIDSKARINALKFNSVLRLKKVKNSHNHVLSPRKAYFLQCNRKVTDSVKRVLDANDLASIKMNKIYNAHFMDVRGYKSLTCLEKYCRNYINKAHKPRLIKGGAGALVKYFGRMQSKNDGLFSLMLLDDDNRLQNIF